MEKKTQAKIEQIEFLTKEEHTKAISNADLGFFLAGLLQWPIVAIEKGDQVGPFVKARYTPYNQPDPDIIVRIDDEVKSVAFNKLILRLQAHRRNFSGDPAAWLKKGIGLFYLIQGALQGREEHEQEFVLTWAKEVVTGMRIIEKRLHPPVTM